MNNLNILARFKVLITSKEIDISHLRGSIIKIISLWTFIISLSVIWGILNENKDLKQIAENLARSAFKQDQSFRFWATSHGGVYVPVTKDTPPNPNLAHITNRDIQKPDGTKLTLMNPAYMVRQMINNYPGLYGAKSRIVSLKYLHEGNKPDKWEENALKLFEKGDKEAYEYTNINSKPYLRLMQPMYIAQRCLKCHAVQGYKLGDVRGGVGVSIPLENLYILKNNNITLIIIGHIIIWIVVLLLIVSFALREVMSTLQRIKADKLVSENEKYLKELFNIIPNILITTDGNHLEKANQAMLNFTKSNSIEDFMLKHECICDLFLEGDDLIQAKMGEDTWIEYILKNHKEVHKVDMMHNNQKQRFIVLARLIKHGKKNHSIVTFINITKLEEAYTELHNQEEIMIAQSRHAAMGEMISMIAHQWRQPLSVISMNANNIMADIELDIVDNKTLHTGAVDIIAQTQELSKTIDDFKNFFRPEKKVEDTLLEDIFIEAFKVVGKSLENNDIKIIKQFNCKKKIKTYSRELMQVFINIIKNAKETLVTKNIKKREITIIIEDYSDNVEIKICDNAGGVPKDIIDKIFNPYFTTKEEASGTGLGLYMSKTIVEKHLKGKIDVYNSNEGACFVLKLPHIVQE